VSKSDYFGIVGADYDLSLPHPPVLDGGICGLAGVEDGFAGASSFLE